MRTVQNPNKTALIKPYRKVVVLVITHLPEMESEYHRQRRAVILKSLQGLMFDSHVEHDLIIWDNGSCDELRLYLAGMFSSRNVMLSPNIGKTNALKSVLSMLPPETIVAYGDDDIEYFSNWLAPQIEILETFPNVGTVTGYPTRLESRWGEDTTKKWMMFDVANALVADPSPLNIGKHISDEWEQDYCLSHNRDWETHKLNTKNDMDWMITYKGVSAFATSQHCQFVGYAGRLAPLIQWTNRAMAEEQPFDKAIDNAGYLRLATTERLTRHIGNVLEKIEA